MNDTNRNDIREKNGKIEMFEEVPGSFHESLTRTLQNLPEEKRRHFGARRWIAAAAAAVMLLGVMTVAAAELFAWNPLMRERAGTNPEMEAELIMKGQAREEQAADSAEGVEIRAIQSMRTARGFYFLLEVTAPEGMKMDGDTIVEQCTVECEKELSGCGWNIADPRYLSQEASARLGKDVYYLEVSILAKAGVDYDGTPAVICLENLIQTKKTDKTDTLVEAVWRLPVTLYGDLDMVCFPAEQEIEIKGHSLKIRQVQANAFELRLFYEDSESVRHALRYSTAQVTGVRLTDGTTVKQESNMLSIGFAKTDTGEEYIRAELSAAVSPEQLAAILINDGEAEITLRGAEKKEISKNAPTGMDLEAELAAGGYTLLYEREGWAVTTNDDTLELWDVECNRKCVLADLKALGYDAEKGGLIEKLGPGGKLFGIVRTADSEREWIVFVTQDGQLEPVEMESESDETFVMPLG